MSQSLRTGLTHFQERQLHNLAQLLDLLLAATHVRVRDRRTLLDLHHGDRRVNLGRQGDEDLVVCPVDTVWLASINRTMNPPNTHAFLNIGRRDTVAKTNNKLGNLLDGNDIAVTVGVTGTGTVLGVERLVLGLRVGCDVSGQLKGSGVDLFNSPARMIVWQRATCRGCSPWRCLSAMVSQRLAGARPVSDSLTPIFSSTRF